MIRAAMLCRSAVFAPMSMSSLCGNSSSSKPNHIGVPTAPNTVGVALKIRHSNATRIAGKPSPTRIGAASAAGVPNPQAPSIRKTKAQPTSMSCATRLLEIPRSHVLQDVHGARLLERDKKENGAENDGNRRQGIEKSGDNRRTKEGNLLRENR